MSQQKDFDPDENPDPDGDEHPYEGEDTEGTEKGEEDK